MNRKKFIRNIGTGFVGQLIIIILGLIVPRIMITSYGSDTNGLLSTISQIFAYKIGNLFQYSQHWYSTFNKIKRNLCLLC